MEISPIISRHFSPVKFGQTKQAEVSAEIMELDAEAMRTLADAILPVRHRRHHHRLNLQA
jgi:hypothetical protein